MSFETYMDAHYPGWRDAARDPERQPEFGELRAVHAAGGAEEQARVLAILDEYRAEWGSGMARVVAEIRAAIATPAEEECDHPGRDVRQQSNGLLICIRCGNAVIPAEATPAQPSGEEGS